MRLSEEALISSGEIGRRVETLAAEIRKAHSGESPLLVLTVLKGSIIFAADLVRALRIPVELEYIRAKSYDGMRSRGEVRFTHLPEAPLRGRQVLVVEDILDTGLTAAAVLSWIKQEGASSVRICTLLDKPSRRRTDVSAEHVGFEIEDLFVVGYGLDFNECFRELPDIRVLVSD